MNFKAVLFDMDGVIVDSFEAWFKLFNLTRKHFGLKEITKEVFTDDVWGGPIERDAKIYFGKRSVKEIIRFYFDNFGKFFGDMKLFPNASFVLEELRKKGKRIGLVTNTPKKQAYSLLEHLNLKKYFDAIVCGDEVSRGKPEPDIMILACERLNINTKDSVLIGDTKADMVAGKKAKCHTVGFRINNGDKRIDELKELLGIVK